MADLPYSIHSFMFPFSWTSIAKGLKHTSIFSKKTKLADFNNKIESVGLLKRKIYTIGTDERRYNEYTYFHDFVRQSLYDTGESTDFTTTDQAYYELEGSNGDQYVIHKKGQSYTLKIDSICMHVFNSGIGILTYNLINEDNRDKSDVLCINEYGRRIYPQYIGWNWDINAAKDSFLADTISITINGNTFIEDFSSYQNGVSIDSTFIPPKHISCIFGYNGQDSIGDPNHSFVFTKKDESSDIILITKMTDDRMFFQCYIHDEVLANSLGKDYKTSRFWYAYVHGDADEHDVTIKNDDLMKEELEKLTYARWCNTYNIDTALLDANQVSFVKSSTLFGMTRDSFVAIGHWEHLFTHMQTMYYQMAILCLAQRCTILRFSAEVRNITYLLEGNSDPTPAIKDLYKNYIKFINKLYFREVTPQIQGIEMYSKFHTSMNIEKEVKDLDSEISELHTYITMVEQTNLGKIAMWFLPPSLIAGLFGMSVFNDNVFKFETDAIDLHTIGWIFATIGLSFIIVFFLNYYLNKILK